MQEEKASSTQKIKDSNEDFHLSFPQFETLEHEMYHKSAPGSSSSLDELCGRKKNKEERLSKFSKKLFGKKDREESEQVDGISTENIPNGTEVTVKENDVDIDICPIDHVADSEEPDINIYPLDPLENHLPNGHDASSETKERGDCPDGRKTSEPEIVPMNHVKAESTAASVDKHSASDELYQQVLSGNMDVQIPNLAKIVRIFTSSTFTGKKQLEFRLITSAECIGLITSHCLGKQQLALYQVCGHLENVFLDHQLKLQFFLSLIS